MKTTTADAAIAEIAERQTFVEATRQQLKAEYAHRGTVTGLGHTIAIAGSPARVRQAWIQLDCGTKFSIGGGISDLVWEVLTQAFSRGGRFVLYSKYAELLSDPTWYSRPICIMALDDKPTSQGPS